MRKYWLLASVIFVGVILRLYKISELFHFTYDEEIFAFVGKRMFLNQHIPLIGGVTPMHVHVAPYFYWLSGIFLRISQFDPIGWGTVAALIAGVSMLILYATGKKLFNKRVALIAVLLYALSFSQNIFDRHYWGLMLDGIWGLLTLLSLHQLLHGNRKYLWVLAVVFFFAFHTDPSTLVVFLLTGFVLFIGFFKPRWLSGNTNLEPLMIRGALVALSAFCLSLAPIVVFDVRHNFSNSRGIFQYIEELKTPKQKTVSQEVSNSFLFLPRVLGRSLFVFGDSDLAKQYSYCPHYAQGKLRAVPTITALGIIGLLIFIFWIGFKNKKYTTSFLLLAFLFFSTYVGIVLYGIVFKGDLFDHYVSTLLPPFFLLVGSFIDHFSRRKFQRVFWILLLLLFTLANLNLLLQAKHRFGYSDKQAAVEWAIAQTENTDFSLDVIGDCFRYNGYRYLFWLGGKEPTKSYVDANFTHLFDVPPAQTHPPLLVVLTNRDERENDAYWQEYEAYQQKTIKTAVFGNIEVLIVDNRNLEFVGKF